MKRQQRLFSASVDSIVRTTACEDIGKILCGLTKTKIGQPEWKLLVDETLEKCKSHVFPSILISSAALGHSLTFSQSAKISASIANASMSDFDKAVCVIGASQIGFRSVELVALAEGIDCQKISRKFLIPFSLAIANLGIQGKIFSRVVTQWPIEDLDATELANAILAIVTSRTFPISSIERILAQLEKSDFPNQTDSITIAHGLTCLEVFPQKVFRTILTQISRSQIPDQLLPFFKQVVVSLFLDPKAREIAAAISPSVWERMEAIDWSLPEPQKNVSGDLIAEISALFNTLGEQSLVEEKPKSLHRLADWTNEDAKRVVLERMYVSDIDVNVCTSKSKQRIFVHIDSETFPDLEEGPIDAYLQVKHLQLRKAGAKVVWIQPQVWHQLGSDEKIDFVKNSLQL